MKLIKTFLINGIIVTITSLILRCIGMFFNSYISQKIGAEALRIIWSCDVYIWFCNNNSFIWN